MSFDVHERLPRLLAHLDARLAVHPEYADLRNLRGLVHALRHDYTAAGADFEAALRANPHYHVARANWAWSLLECGDARAAEVANAIPEAALPEWPAHWHLVQRVHAEGAAAVRGGLAAAAGEAGPWSQLDALWVRSASGDTAGALAQIASLADPVLRQAFAALGLTAGSTAPETALHAWARGYRGNPLAAAVWWAAAEIERFDGSAARGLHLLHWGVVQSFDVYTYELELAKHQEATGGEAEAIATLQRAAAREPGRAQAYIGLGYALAARGQADAARAALERAIDVEPRFPDVRYQLALLCLELGSDAAAEESLRVALEVQPDYAPAQLALATLLHAQGRDAEALPLLQGVRRSGLRSTDLDRLLGEAYERLGRTNQARRAYARARAAERRNAGVAGCDGEPMP